MRTIARSRIARLLLGALALTCAAVGLVVATAGRADAAAATTSTQQFVIRPVRANGTPAAGFRVIPPIPELRGMTVNCFAVSPAAVDPNIRSCYPTATGALSCWKSSKHTVLCVADLLRRQLVRFRYAGTFAPATPTARPTPQDVVLRVGNVCAQRFGGAWDVVEADPEWAGHYSCSGNVYLYGPPNGDGLVRSFTPWLAHAVTFHPVEDRVHDAAVARVYYVGTAV